MSIDRADLRTVWRNYIRELQQDPVPGTEKGAGHRRK